MIRYVNVSRDDKTISKEELEIHDAEIKTLMQLFADFHQNICQQLHDESFLVLLNFSFNRMRKKGKYDGAFSTATAFKIIFCVWMKKFLKTIKIS